MKRKICLKGIKYVDIHNVIHLSKNINDIDDLIDLGYIYESGKKYNIDLKKVYDIQGSLIKLRNMVGLHDVKMTLVHQILYFLQDFHDDEMLHTVIQGPPGVGKTMLAGIIGEIYHKMNVFKNTVDIDDKRPKLVIARRSDLIGEYLGKTAVKTQAVIDSSKGGVLLIDEAYALGNKDTSDSYSKECIDTLNQNLSENKGNFLCIIAGYKDALENNFFNYNEGLKRRFPFVYTIESYTHVELCEIFYDIFRRDKWICKKDDKILNCFLNKSFKNMAGDMETLAFKTKMEHSKRVLFLHKSKKKVIQLVDIENAMKDFCKEYDKISKLPLSFMYM
jgi:SpoVK/Ycf46/Vps4 family AAA+-type ATPase